ncbi:MAG TPA: transcription termination/antitermination NusG family protein [bacterium]|nr:transcription termination/antitermination NusG family protein [bacterium]
MAEKVKNVRERDVGEEDAALLDPRICLPESRFTIHDSRLSWYVIQTKPLSEDSVELHLKNASFETFNPKIRTMIRGAKRGVSRVRTLFPSYLFAHIDLTDSNLYRMIKYTRGVRKILGDGASPVPVPDVMIEIIRDRVNEEGVIEQRLTMKKGDAVRIRGGLFRDLVGILEKPVTAAGRVKVLLQIMRHQVRCELSAGEVEKLTD